ncbi:hypothetical protein DKZ34_03455 [Limosilactobacillus reuteri]|nr:hypothetical protein DKZ34_03455 [Limosilactobacillus reuteri]
METNFINNLKSGLRFLNRSKIIVRILLFENQKLIVNSQPLFSFLRYLIATKMLISSHLFDNSKKISIIRKRSNNWRSFYLSLYFNFELFSITPSSKP